MSVAEILNILLWCALVGLLLWWFPYFADASVLVQVAPYAGAVRMLL
jgi:hypothetical protein